MWETEKDRREDAGLSSNTMCYAIDWLWKAEHVTQHYRYMQ
jgi:hypothetical protein